MKIRGPAPTTNNAKHSETYGNIHVYMYMHCKKNEMRISVTFVSLAQATLHNMLILRNNATYM